MMRALINSRVFVRLTVMILIGLTEMPEAFEENETNISHSITVHSYNTYVLIAHKSFWTQSSSHYAITAMMGTDLDCFFQCYFRGEEKKGDTFYSSIPYGMKIPS